MNHPAAAVHWRGGLTGLLLAALSWALPAHEARAARLIVWAWERPEDLRVLPPGVEVAAQTGFISLSGARVVARGRRFPLLARPEQVTTHLVHVQIDPRAPLAWTPAMRERTVAAILAYGLATPAKRVQVDFEVRASQRSVLLDVLHDVRAGLPQETQLSMTALADWCDTESWVATAPVDEIAPMLFRMGRAGAPLRARLSAGGDFALERCHGALAISTDTPIPRAPGGRRVYLFNPRTWTAAAFETIEREVERWDGAKS